jgi:endonuclease III
MARDPRPHKARFGANTPHLRDVVDALDDGAPPLELPRDPFELILYENAGALVDDERRAALFRRIIAAGSSPKVLLSTAREALLAISKDGGMRPETRVERWYEIARLTLTEADGDLATTLRQLDTKKRRALLRRFPVIGEPGADKVLLFCDIAPEPSADSNVLRVLERLQLIETGDYTKEYRAARELQRAAYGTDSVALRRAYQVLRAHGKTVCRRSDPLRSSCPLGRHCSGMLTH